jgi:hypothetical protein
MVLDYEARFMELLRYAPHLNTKKLKVNKFMFGLNVNIHANVRFIMPQTLHDFVQKALITEEELISKGQRKTLVRPARQALLDQDFPHPMQYFREGLTPFPYADSLSLIDKSKDKNINFFHLYASFTLYNKCLHRLLHYKPRTSGFVSENKN